MILVDKYYIFHISKTGLSFLRYQLYERKKIYFDIQGRIKNEDFKSLHTSHLTYDELINIKYLKNLLNDDTIFIVIIRNPIERFNSAFQEYVKQEYFNSNKIKILNNKNTNKIYQKIIDRLENLERSNIKTYEKNLVLFKPQHLYLNNIPRNKIKIFKFGSEELKKFFLNFDIEYKNYKYSDKDLRKSFTYFRNNKLYSLLLKLDINYLSKFLQFNSKINNFNLDTIIPNFKDDMMQLYKKDFILYDKIK
tara:strand:- start:2474 stop:3223 length:750 start_codon:yes stop_codon:yes gene_type:complete